LVYKKLNPFEFAVAILTALAISIFYLFFNFNYLSKWVDEKGDVLTYDYYVRLGLPEYLYNPHHIGFDWLGKSMYDALKQNGYSGKVMPVLQLRNLIISSIALGAIFFLLYKISKKYILSLLIVASISFTAAYWMYSQINDTPIIHSVTLAILFLILINYPFVKKKALFSVFLGIYHSLNIFFHQSNVLFIIVIFFVYFFSEYFYRNYYDVCEELSFIYKKSRFSFQKFDKLRFNNIKYFLLYFSVFLVIVISGYYYVGIVKIGLTFDKNKATNFNNIKDSTYFFNWLILYTKIDHWGKGLSDDSTLKKASEGITNYFFQPQKFKNQDLKADFKNPISPNSILPNMVGFIFIFVLLSTIVFFQALFKKYNYLFLTNLLFLSIYTAFSLWWEPDYREFWVVTMFPFWFLFFFILNFLIDAGKKAAALVKIPAYIFLFVLCFSLFYFNFTGFIYKHAGSDYRKFDIVKEKQ